MYYSRRFSHRIRNDARKIMDGAACATSCACSRGHLLELSRGRCFRSTLGATGSRSATAIIGACWLGRHFATCVGGFPMTVARAVWHEIESSDYRLMRRVHRWRAPRWFRITMIVATRGGDGWLWYAFGLILLLCGGERRFAALEAGGLSAAAGIALFRALKRTSKRKRPCEIEPHCWASILPPDKYSFPSGHAITAFAVAVSVGFFYPYLEISLLAAAFLIAASRNHSAMHFLSDVIAGSAIGIVLGFASFHILAISDAPEHNLGAWQRRSGLNAFTEQAARRGPRCLPLEFSSCAEDLRERGISGANFVAVACVGDVTHHHVHAPSGGANTHRGRGRKDRLACATRRHSVSASWAFAAVFVSGDLLDCFGGGVRVGILRNLHFDFVPQPLAGR